MDDYDRQSLRERLAYWPRGKAMKVNTVRASIRPDEKQLAMLREGDELWWYDSPQELWDALAGRAGFAVVRDGEIADFWFTMIN